MSRWKSLTLIASVLLLVGLPTAAAMDHDVGVGWSVASAQLVGEEEPTGDFPWWILGAAGVGVVAAATSRFVRRKADDGENGKQS